MLDCTLDCEVETADADTQTQFSKTKDESIINELKQDMQDMRNEYEVKESHMKLEINMLKAKLEEQTQINLGTKKILALENKSLDFLTRRINRYLDSLANDNEEDEDNDAVSETKGSANNNTEELKNTTKEFSSPTKDNASSGQSDSGLSVPSKAETVSSEFDSKYATLKAKVESLIEMNKKIKTELKVKQKRDSSEERKILEHDQSTDKISSAGNQKDLSLLNVVDADDPYLSESMGQASKMKNLQLGNINLPVGTFTLYLKSFNSLFDTMDLTKYIVDVIYRTKCSTPANVYFAQANNQGAPVFIQDSQNVDTSNTPRNNIRSAANSFNNNNRKLFQ